MNLRTAPLALSLFIALPAFAGADDAAPVAGRPTAQNPALSPVEYQQGLAKLRKYLQSRGEKPEVIDKFVGDLQTTPAPPREIFTTFLDYEAAWARKTRDAKNPKVAKPQLQHEIDNATALKNRFKILSRGEAPGFLTAFENAVKDVRAQRAAQNPGGQPGPSTASFGDQVDDSFTQVDAGDEALQNGDAAGAVADAQQALAENPANADAQALLAGGEYAQGNMSGAAADAQTALALDPTNQQAQAIADLANPAPAAAANTATDAQAISQNLTGNAAPAPAPASPGTPGVAAVPAGLAPVDPPMTIPPLAPAAAPATPALASRLSADLTTLASKTMGIDPIGTLPQIDRALALDPTNTRAWNLRSAVASRAKDYTAALAAADKAISLDPKNGRGFFNRARALAGQGDRPGMIDALREAAALDVKYEQKLEASQELPADADLKLLFPKSLDAAPPTAAKNSELPTLKILGGIGGTLLLLALLALLPEKKKKSR